MARVVRSVTALLVAGTLATGARAGLGGGMASVEADRGRMDARMVSQTYAGYARHGLTRPNGGTVQELTNAAGEVFAVTWSGPGKPDLRALLGPHFAALQSAGTGGGRTLHALRRPPQVAAPDLQIATEGHMGWFRGVALIPSLAPPGLSASDLATTP